jgi:polysaccharide biosynthesis transport protein
MDNKAPQSFSNEIKQYLEIFRRWVWLLFLFTLIGGGATYFFSVRQEKIYRASATVLIDQPQQSLDYASSISNDRLSQTYSQLMVQQPTLEGVIERLGLDMSVRDLSKALAVNVVQDTQLLRIVVEDTDPERAAEIVNTIGIVFAEKTEELQAARYRETKTSLETQMAQMDAQIQETTQALNLIKGSETVDFQVNLLEVELETYRQIYQGLLLQIVELETQPTATEAPSLAESQETPVISSPVEYQLAAIEAKIIEISTLMDAFGYPRGVEYDLLDTQLTVYKNLYSQLVRDLIYSGQETPTGIASSELDILSFSETFRPDIDTLSSQLEITGERILSITAQINAAGGTANNGVERDRLESNLALYRQTYANLVQSYEQVRLAEIQNTSRVDLVQPATPPIIPIRPDIVQNTLLGLVVGLVSGGIVVFLIEMLDDTIKGPGDVIQHLKLPILGYVAHMEENGDDPITIAQPRSPLSEAFRSIRTNIQYSSIDHPLQSILITSPTPRDGKSTVAANLGVVLAHGEYNVTVIDADMRRPRQHKIFGLPNRKGLSETLVRTEFDLNGNLHKKEGVKNLSILTTGDLPPNPSELIGSDKMLEFIQLMKSKSDIVIIDTPPVTTVTDPVILATLVDGVILVLRPGATKLAAAIQATEQLKQVGANVIGVVLNDSDNKSSRYYHHYKGYYYQYGKNYAYSTGGEKKKWKIRSGEKTRRGLSSSPIRPWMWFAIVGVIGLILVSFFTKSQLIPFWDIHLSEDAVGIDEMLIKPTTTEKPLVNTLTSTPTPAFLITPSPIAQLIPTHSPTETAIDLPMKTLAVTITPYSSKPTLGPGLMTPFGPNSEYVFHQVQTGESLPHLAASYQTSTDAIITVNGLEPNQPLQPGQFIIITRQVEDLEIFPVSILSLEADTMITDIAAQYEISVDDLRYYNELGSSEFIPAGRLIIIPPKVNPNKFSTEPFGPNDEYILHKVKPGDSFPILEALYQTSAEVIRKSNSISGILLVDMVVVIVVGETDPSEVQPFKMVFVEVETPINELAIYYRATEFDLIYYNDLEVGKLVPAGRWLICPTAK